MSRHFSTKELACICSVTLRQIQWWCEHGLVSPHMNGHARVFTAEEALLAMVAREIHQKGRCSKVDLRRVPTVMLRRAGNFLLTDGKRFTWRGTAAETIKAYVRHPGALHLIDVAALDEELAQRIERLKPRVSPTRSGKVLSAGGGQ